MKTLNENLTKALKINTNQTEIRIANAVLLRLKHLGYTDTCGRCGGSGEYSWNSHDGSRCYGCNGNGFVMPKVTDSLIENVAKDVESGKLEPYFGEVRVLHVALKAEKIVLDAWKNTGIDSKYDWRKAAKGVPEDRRVSDINADMCAIFEDIQKQASAVRSLKGTERKEKAVKLGEATETAVQKINDLAKRI